MEGSPTLQEARHRKRRALTEKIRQIHHRSRRIYGYRRVHAELIKLWEYAALLQAGYPTDAKKPDFEAACVVGRSELPARTQKHAVAAPELVKRNFSGSSQRISSRRRISVISILSGGLCVYLAFILEAYSPERCSAGRWLLSCVHRVGGRCSGDGPLEKKA